ncbi:hypothetical protein K1719_043594 [Acacia pycnantha]|nr:hypothetical protein K1719_043594 [Acacia pycnantha]
MFGESSEALFWLQLPQALKRSHQKENQQKKWAEMLVSVGDLEVAVSLLLSTPPACSYFYLNAVCAVALSSTVSRSLHELAVKV